MDALAHGAAGERALRAVVGGVNTLEDRLAEPLDLAVTDRAAAPDARVFVARRGMVAAAVLAALERVALARWTTPHDARRDRDHHRPEEARSTHLFPRSFSLHRLALMEHGTQAEPP